MIFMKTIYQIELGNRLQASNQIALINAARNALRNVSKRDKPFYLISSLQRTEDEMNK